MKDEFYVVLPSNSSVNYFPENTTTHFVTQLPQQIRLQGTWSVAITEIQIPLTFQHITSDLQEREVIVKRVPHSVTETNEINTEPPTSMKSYLYPGVYKSLESLVDDINNLEGVKDHLIFLIEHSGYISVKRVCTSSSCLKIEHYLQLSDKLRKIFGFEMKDCLRISTGENGNGVIGNRPANLTNGLPSTLMIYSDI